MSRILIIDDSRVMRDMLSDFLVDNGFEVEAVEDPQDGLALAREQAFDLCICDMHLIGTDGCEVVTMFGREFPSLRCIVTDSLPDEKSEQVLLADQHFYIRKPFELVQIRELRQKALSKARNL